MDGAELYECEVTPGAYSIPKWTAGGKQFHDKHATADEMNVYITSKRNFQVLSQLPDSNYVCEEKCGIRYPNTTSFFDKTIIKVYRSGGVAGDPPLCVKESPVRPESSYFTPTRIEVSKLEKLKAKAKAWFGS